MRAVFFAVLWCALAETGVNAGNNQDYAQLVERGRAAHRNGHFPAAETLLSSALKTADGADPLKRAGVLSDLGEVYLSQDDLPKAERSFSESLSLYRGLDDAANIPRVMRNLGTVYSLEQRHDDALRLLQQALKLLKADPSADAALLAQTLNSAGVAHYRQQSHAKAENFFQEAMRTASKAGVQFDMAQVLNNLGAVYYATREFEKSEKLFKQALSLTEAELPAWHADLTFTLSSLGLLYTTTGKYREAEDQYMRVLAILELEPIIFEPRRARILHALSTTYKKARRNAESDAALARAAEIARRRIAQYPDMALILDDYAASLKSHGKTKEADALILELKRARTAAGLVIHAHSPF